MFEGWDDLANGEYFMDQASGQYYFQSWEEEAVVMLEPEAFSLEDVITKVEEEEQDFDDQKVSEEKYQINTMEPESHILIGQHGVGGEKERKIKGYIKEENIKTLVKCNNCSYTTSKKYLLSQHKKIHSGKLPFICNICEKRFRSSQQLQNHTNAHTGTKPHKCKYCESKYTTSSDLMRHVRYKHTHDKPHQCPDCQYASVERVKIVRHMRIHTGERPFQCPHCSYACAVDLNIKRHIRIHTGEKPYECDICYGRFTQNSSMKTHRKIHTGDKPVYQCELCPITCGRIIDLRTHVKRFHCSENPLQCMKCDEYFPDKHILNAHKMIHTDEKCFKCALCPYSAIQQRLLDSHVLTHTDQKPFICDSCDQSFRQLQLLKRHQNLHHNQYYIPPVQKEKQLGCLKCDRNFRHPGNLKRHIALHNSGSIDITMALNIQEDQKIMKDDQMTEMMAVEDRDEDMKSDTIILLDQEQKQFQELENEQYQEQDIPKDLMNTAGLGQEEIRKITKERDLATCFGFDVESDSE